MRAMPATWADDGMTNGFSCRALDAAPPAASSPASRDLRCPGTNAAAMRGTALAFFANIQRSRAKRCASENLDASRVRRRSGGSRCSNAARRASWETERPLLSRDVECVSICPRSIEGFYPRVSLHAGATRPEEEEDEPEEGGEEEPSPEELADAKHMQWLSKHVLGPAAE
mmetsp:Transcript_14711/g.32326  ORF Transcript_14711/g.32326 Transcript_14711/m.32326 type:complete len:171 (+) Transcript_14711:902-1414(+)